MKVNHNTRETDADFFLNRNQNSFSLRFFVVQINGNGKIELSHRHKHSLYLVEAPLAPITASGPLGCDTTSFAHLDLAIFCHSSLQILSCCVRSNVWFSSLSRDAQSGFKSGLRLGHSLRVVHSCVVLATCVASLSWVSENSGPGLMEIVLCSALCFFPAFPQLRDPVPAAENNPALPDAATTMLRRWDGIWNAQSLTFLRKWC